MPHVIVKVQTGRTELQKRKVAQEVTRAVMSALGCAADSVSVGIEDVSPSDWTAQVYQPDILGKPKTIYKKPNY
jgi:4-oxalocrotonate tautomerase